jgi:opacity protein-like surface antigen
MKKIILGAILAACLGAAGAAADHMEPEQLSSDMEQVRKKARAGDYHAQRMLAYAYATGDRLQGKRFPVAGCAWYLSIPYLNTQFFNVSDSSGIHSTCSNLPPDQFYAAVRYSAAIVNGTRASGR